MSALWIHEIADRFWTDAGGAPPNFPRDLLEVACWALPVASVEVSDLSIARVNAWLADRDSELRLTVPNRPLRACSWCTRAVACCSSTLLTPTMNADSVWRMSLRTS